MSNIIHFKTDRKSTFVTHTNFKGKKYFLHEGVTKKGSKKYTFSLNEGGDDLVQEIPDGFEVYENPNGQVFCRKIQPNIITEKEIEIVRSGMEKFSDVEMYKIDVKKNDIIVYIPNHGAFDAAKRCLDSSFIDSSQPESINEFALSLLHYTPEMKFTLVDVKSRDFIVQRYNYLGSIDDWMPIANGHGKLGNLVEKYVVHLGKESFFELY